MNRALRRLVQGEETAKREKRARLQQILRARLAEAAAAAADAGEARAEDDEPDEDELIEQQKLLASASAPWRCLEDSQQAVCIAANRRQTLLAIGEKDGRISIWDNTTIRVITKELDPTLIVLPTEAEPASDEPLAKRAKLAPEGDDSTADDQDGSADGDSATNEEGSVDGNDDVSVEADEEEEENGGSIDADETGSVEDNVSVDDNNGDDQGDVDDDVAMAEAAAVETMAPRKLSESQALSLEELRIAKSSLKHVLSITWSCDSRFLFAGCEEKSTRRGRLCVWDAESAWLLATFSFDGAVNALSAHPTDPNVVIVCSYNALPVLLNFRTREMTEIAVPITNDTLTVTPPPNSRHPSLVVCCRYGVSGRFIYCATSKSTVAILDSDTLECVDIKLLSILVQFVDLTVNLHETALVFTSSKGIHEYAIQRNTEEATDGRPSLHESRLYATGAVRAPWALCCFSSDGGYVVGMPIVRHRHVGESGLYTWHRATGRVQHNLGVKDGVNSICWDIRRDAIVVVSCAGSIHVLEEEFKTEWPGTMYPAGFRLVTDNELDMEALEREVDEQEGRQQGEDSGEKSASAEPRILEVFAFADDDDDWEKILPPVESELRHIPSIPITQHMKRHFHHDFHIERHFGLGQSVFEPLKSAIKKPSSNSSKKKKKSSSTSDASATSSSQQQTASSKSKSKSKSSSSKKRRR